MKVKDLMTTDVTTCDVGDDLSRVARLMWDEDRGFVVVLTEGGRVAGTITDRDACMAAYTRGLPLASMCAAEAMARGVVSCAADDDLQQAAERMRAFRVRRLPVVDSQLQLLGVITLADLAHQAAAGRGKAAPGVSLETVVATLSAVSQPFDLPVRLPIAAPAGAKRSFEPRPQLTA